MHRAFADPTHPTAGLRVTAVAIFTALAVLLLALAPAAGAQDASPEASPAASPSADGNVLIQYDVETMPNAPMTVRLLRITLEPGASVPMHTPAWNSILSNPAPSRPAATAPASSASAAR